MKVTLRPYQIAGVESIRAAFRSGAHAPLFVLPTGGGKSVILAYIAEQAAARGKRILIVAHRQELIFQLSAKLKDVGLEHGVISPLAQPQYDARVQVASVQTLIRRFAHVALPDLVIFDEAHHVAAGNMWDKVTTTFPDALRLGFTATPCRLDGKGLGKNFDALVQGPTVKELTDLGYLCPAVYYAPRTKLDLSGIEIRAGDYVTSELAKRMARPEIIGDAVRHYRELCPGKPALAFCANVEHAQQVAEEFCAAGFRAASVDGTTDSDTRARLIAALGSGSLDVLTNCQIVSEGTDVPVVAAAIMLRPTKSLTLWMQMVGRCLRPASEKTRAIILDHASNSLEHGFADDTREWSLEGKHKRNKAAPTVQVTTCPNCFVNHYSAACCPQCGHVYETKPIQEIKQSEGELVEITDAQREAIVVARKREVSRAKTLEDLQAIALARGYKPGWARHILQSRRQRKFS